MNRPQVKRIVTDLESTDEDIATYAAMSILRLKEISSEEIEELLPLLRKATTSASISVRFFARKALNEVKLGMRRHPRLIAEMERLRDETRQSSWSSLLDGLLGAPVEKKLLVIDLLKDLDDPKILPALLDYLAAERDEFVVAETIRVLGLVGSSEQIPVLEQYLKHRDSRIRSNSAEALDHIGGNAVIQSILPLLDDDDNRVKATVAKLLSHHGEPRVLVALSQMVRSVEVWMRESAIYALGYVPYQEAVELLLEALVDANTDVRIKAIESLAKLHARRALDYLQAIASSSDTPVAQAASQALRVIRPHAIDYDYLEPDSSQPGPATSGFHRRPHSGTRAAAARSHGRQAATAEARAEAGSPGAAPAGAKSASPPPDTARPGSFARRLLGGQRRADRKEQESLAAKRDELLLEIGKQVMLLFHERALERSWVPDFDHELKKLQYLIDQTELHRQSVEKDSQSLTFTGFLREAIRFFTHERQTAQRLASLQERLERCYRDVGRRAMDEPPDSVDLQLLQLQGLPEAVRKLDRLISELEPQTG